MLNICESYGVEYSMSFNGSKSVCIKFSKNGQQPDIPVYLNGNSLQWPHKVKHLGNWLRSDLKDDTDIDIKKGQLIASINKIVNKFPKASYKVKCILLRTYCTSFYGSQCWNMYSTAGFSNMWNRGVRRLFNLPYVVTTS